jgi:hypothetical protein
MIFRLQTPKSIPYLLEGWHERLGLHSDGIFVPLTNGITKAVKYPNKQLLKQGAQTNNSTGDHTVDKT